MSNFAIELLKKCKHCKLPNLNGDETYIHIDKQIPKKDPEFSVGKCFLICIDDYILNPPEGFTLAKNWNANTNPPCKYMNISVLQIMGKMVKIEGIGFDMNEGKPINATWTGWLPIGNVQIMEEI